MTATSLGERMGPTSIMTGSIIITGDRYLCYVLLHSTTHVISFRNQSKGTLTCHHGSCHCGRVKFRLFAPRILKVVDCGNTKLRFIRFSTKHEFFETVAGKALYNLFAEIICYEGEDCVSHYAVHNENAVGIYVFCSYCSVQILYAPHINPVEVQINIDCLEKSTIDDVIVAYHASLETMPYSDVDQLYNRRGKGGNSSQASLQLVWNLLHSFCAGDGLSPVKTPDPRKKEKAVPESPHYANDLSISLASNARMPEEVPSRGSTRL